MEGETFELRNYKTLQYNLFKIVLKQRFSDSRSLAVLLIPQILKERKCLSVLWWHEKHVGIVQKSLIMLTAQ